MKVRKLQCGTAALDGFNKTEVKHLKAAVSQRHPSFIRPSSFLLFFPKEKDSTLQLSHCKVSSWSQQYVVPSKRGLSVILLL